MKAFLMENEIHFILNEKDSLFYETASSDRYEILKHNARKNRCRQTDAETIVWEYLRAGRMGVKFRRQHPIADYIVDFVCLNQGLIVEIDGEYHNDSAQMDDDRIREYRLTSLGYRVLRFTNQQVMEDIDSVTEKIKNSLYNY